MSTREYPKISVLIPIHNGEKTLVRALKSVRRQSYKNLEIIAIDDGSTDRTRALLDKIASIDPRVKILSKPFEGNLARTRNFLLDNCTTEYFCWVDCDDVAKRKYVMAMYKNMVKKQSDLSACAVRINPYIKLPIFKLFSFKSKVYTDIDKFRSIILTGTVNPSTWCKLYKRSIVGNLRFDEVARFSEDTLFNWEYAKAARSFSWFGLPLYHYIQKPTGEVHSKLGNKQLAHLAQATKVMETEPDPAKQNIMRAWIALCSCHFRQIALGRGGVAPDVNLPETLALLEGNMSKYEKYHQSRGTWWVFRMAYWYLKRKGNKEKRHYL